MKALFLLLEQPYRFDVVLSWLSSEHCGFQNGFMCACLVMPVVSCSAEI